MPALGRRLLGVRPEDDLEEVEVDGTVFVPRDVVEVLGELGPLLQVERRDLRRQIRQEGSQIRGDRLHVPAREASEFFRKTLHDRVDVHLVEPGSFPHHPLDVREDRPTITVGRERDLFVEVDDDAQEGVDIPEAPPRARQVLPAFRAKIGRRVLDLTLRREPSERLSARVAVAGVPGAVAGGDGRVGERHARSLSDPGVCRATTQLRRKPRYCQQKENASMRGGVGIRGGGLRGIADARRSGAVGLVGANAAFFGI